MNVVNLVNLIGYSSISPSFEASMNELKITWRPKATKSRLDISYTIPNTGVSLEFSSSAEEDGIKKKSEGQFILETVEVKFQLESSQDNKLSLPKGLRPDDTRDNVREKVGQPKRINEKSDNYLVDDVIWTFAYKNNALAYMQFIALSDSWRDQGMHL